jgi:MtN3 and saliva related transmembrane protein
MWLESFVEIVFGVCLFINAFLFVPQASRLLKAKNAQNLSLLTFGGFNVIQLFTLLHAYLHKDLVLFFGTLLSLITCGSVSVLILIYRKKD